MATKKIVYTFVSRDKLARAKKSLGKKYEEKELLVAYDKLGGLVLENGKKMKYGNYFKPKKIKEEKKEVKKEIKEEKKEVKKEIKEEKLVEKDKEDKPKQDEKPTEQSKKKNS